MHPLHLLISSKKKHTHTHTHNNNNNNNPETETETWVTTKIEIRMGGFRSTWDHGWVGGFQVGMGGFSSAWAMCGWGAWVAIDGRWCSWLVVGQVQIAVGCRRLKKLSRMGFLGGLVLCNFVFFQKFWCNLSYVFCLVSIFLSLSSLMRRYKGCA